MRFRSTLVLFTFEVLPGQNKIVFRTDDDKCSFVLVLYGAYSSPVFEKASIVRVCDGRS